jgi:hypothetical protein
MQNCFAPSTSQSTTARGAVEYISDMKRTQGKVTKPPSFGPGGNMYVDRLGMINVELWINF